jgi:heme-degrading monooxygenase HmoA
VYLHMTVTKMNPEKVNLACQQWISQEPQVSEIPGMHQALLVESLDEPGRITWLSLWNSLDEARTFLTSPSYMEHMAALHPYLLNVPQWYGFNVLEVITQAEC